MYGLKVFRLFAGRCDSVVVRVRERERDWDSKGLGSNPGLGFSFLLIETLSKTGQRFSLSVLQMAATVYERDNCVAVVIALKAPYSQLRS